MSSKRGGSGVGKEVGETQEQIKRLRQKYGMDFDEFFEAVESFSKLKKLMEKYDLGEILEDSLVWETLLEELEDVRGGNG